VSRVRQSSTGRLRLAPAVVGIAVGAALALTGCSAGQIAQTSGMEPAVNGGLGQAGAIAVRDVRLAYPEDGVYARGAQATVLGVIVNSGRSEDQLLAVTSSAGDVVVTGDKDMPAGKTLVLQAPSGGSSSTSATTTSVPTSSSSTTTTSTPSGSSSSSTSGSATTTTGTSTGTSTTTTGASTTATTTTSPGEEKPIAIGKASIVIKGLREELRSGKTVELTFTFRSGTVTVTVPVATPTTPRAPAAVEEN
jgi:copper(I)-binding protein